MTAQVVTLHQRYGATPADWLHFDLALGLGPDLLPVVSRPGAAISPGSTLKALGKTPSIYNARREVVGIRKWTSHVASDADLNRWSGEPDYGICIQTRDVRALDVDVPDLQLADHIVEVFTRELAAGVLPGRTRPGTGKQLVVFRLVGTFAKRSFRCEGGLVEFLADGQQFVAVGTHPSGDRYSWPEGLPLVIVEITQEAFEQAWLAIVEEFALEPASEGAEGADRGRADLEGIEDPVAVYLGEQGLILGAQGEKLFVDCPWKSGHTGDSGISETAWLVAGTKGFQNGHFQCMHASCASRRDVDFLDSVGYRASAFADLDGADGQDETADRRGSAGGGVGDTGGEGEAHPPWPKFKRDGKGKIEATLHNVQMALARADIVGPVLVFDTFQDTLLADGRPFTDADAVKIRTLLERRGFKPIGRELFRDALTAYQEDHRFDSAIDWLTGLTWDGVERVERSLSTYFKTEDSAYTRACGLYMWTALAGRVMQPGCKADMVIAIQGTQGLGKSGGIERLSPWEHGFKELNLHKLDADLSRKLRGCVVAELAELQGLKTRDAETIRAWIVQKVERWVPKFQEREIAFKRRCVLFATVNPQGFLDDEEGERRWLPMSTRGEGDWAGIERDRDQLWAEGLMRWELGSGVAWRDAERLARREHARFKVQDSWTPRIARWLDEPSDISGESPNSLGYVAIADVASDALGLEISKVNRLVELRIGKALRGLGWAAGTVRVEGEPMWRWVKGK